MRGFGGPKWTLSLLAGSLALGACTDDEQAASAPNDAGIVSSQSTTSSDASTGAAAPFQPSTPAAAPRDAGTGSALGTAADIPCEVGGTLSKYCGSCHTQKGSAPVEFEKTADFMGMSKKEPTKTLLTTVAERLATTDTKMQMPPAGLPRPTADELAKLQAWVKDGAKARAAGASCAGTGTGTTDASTPAVTPSTPVDPNAPLTNGGYRNALGQECYKLLAHDGSSREKKLHVGLATDAYMNMTFNAPWGTRQVYAASIKPVIDNAKVIHHWLLFDEPGVDGAVVPATGAHPIGQLLSGWAPGGDGIDLNGNPDDVGYEMAGKQFTIEFHYNSSDPNAEDASGIEICLLDHTPKNVAALSWLGNDNLVVPSDHWTGQCNPTSLTPIHIVAVTPHMHKAGTRMRGVIHRQGGKDEVLHDEPFNFDYQHSYPKNVVLQPGESITTECWFNKPMLFGENTDQEMCYLFTYAYPKGALADLGAWGAIAHGGSACLE
jgi:mono/diheme cytochrome c family protein